MFCGHCGAPVADDARFCGSCGHPTALGEEQAAPKAAVGPSEAPSFAGGFVPASTAHAAAGAAGSKGAAALGSGRRNALIIGVACVVICIAVVAVLFFTGVLGGGLGTSAQTEGESGGYEGSTYTVISANGTKVTSLIRPTLVTVANDGETLAAPALARYVESQGSSGDASGSTSGDSAASDASSTTSANGSSDAADTSVADTNDAADTSGSGNSDDSGDANGTSSASDSNDASVAQQNVEEANSFGSIGEYQVEAGLANVVNVDDFYLSDSALIDAIAQNGFVVNASDSDVEFYETYETNRYSQLASFVTVDSIMHTYHLYFSHLLKQTEKGYLSQSMADLSQTMLQKSTAQLEALRGTEWEEAAKRNCVFFAVGCLLLGVDAQVPEDLAASVSDEVAKIQAGQGTSTCAVTGDQEDYTQYQPRGYYEGDEQLESYFRAMMWYGRINFTQNAADHEDPSDLNRSALLITIALNGEAAGTAEANWESVYTITSFFAGAADDCGYYEYYPLFQAAYGEDATVDSLAGNESAWNDYNDMTSKMQAPRISSVIVGDETTVTDDDIKGFRFMGQRFSLDESIFTQLTYDNVDDRLLPSAMDLPAALGSQEALSILEDEGETSYGGYTEQMELLRADLANADSSIWEGSLYSQWLYTLNPLLTSKGEGYPSVMQTETWDRKNIQTYLGSYAELKHDTVLYSKQAVAEMGGGPIDHDDRGYVEPEPEVYSRLSNLVQSTSDGLAGYGMLSDADVENLARLKEIADRLETMATKELSGETLTTEEYDFIREYGGQLEHFWDEVNPDVTNTSVTKARESPAAVVVDIATNATDGTVLEVGTGEVNSIYVVVPIEGELHLCKGAVYSYYEFEWPSADRLTDSEWREMLGVSGSTYTESADLPDTPEWTQSITYEK